MKLNYCHSLVVTLFALLVAMAACSDRDKGHHGNDD